MLPSGRQIHSYLGVALRACLLLTTFAFIPSARGQVTPLPNGIELRSGNSILRVIALRDDLLRVRFSPAGDFPEDASWAVPAAIRALSSPVSQESDAHSVGFRTAALRVRVELPALRLVVSDLQGNILQEDASGWPVEFHGPSFRIYKTLPLDEHYFGLGDKAGPLDRRGKSFRLWNTDAFLFQESTDPIYKSIPFFLTYRAGRSLGVFLDNTWSSSFDFGRGERGIYSFGAEGGPLDYYLFYGPSAKTVLETYAWLTGLPPLPPLWSLGFQQSRYSYETEACLREVAARLRADKIPADVLYLDIDFQKDNRPFTVNTTAFPNFAQMVADLKRDSFHLVTITDLHIAKAPNAGYVPYDSGVAGDHFVKNPDGSTFVGTVWPGPSVFPDFTQRKTREWWGTLYQPFVAQGVAGFWNDMNEPSVFETPNGTMPLGTLHRIDEAGFHPRTATHAEIHNVYGTENVRATYGGLLKLRPNTRPFVLTRAAYSGAQRFAATWTGDNTSSWNHLRLTTPMLLNLGLSGFGLSGADVGGFVGTPGAELLTRWTQLASFQPIDRNHATKGSGDREVWVHGPEQEAIRRRYIEERYKLLPYLYTAAEELSRTGIPIVRPVFLEFPDAAPDRHPLDLDAGNEFLFGASLLVAPPPFPEQPNAYPLVLPPGVWYDYWTGAKAPAPGTQIKPQLDTLPVFVREGAILPLQPLVQSTLQKPDGPLTLRIYPGPNCAGSLYQDDGVSFDYRSGKFLRIAFSCEVTSEGVKVRLGSREGNYPPWWTQVRLELYGWDTTAARVTASGIAGTLAVSVNPALHQISVTLPDAPRGVELVFRRVN